MTSFCMIGSLILGIDISICRHHQQETALSVFRRELCPVCAVTFIAAA